MCARSLEHAALPMHLKQMCEQITRARAQSESQHAPQCFLLDIIIFTIHLQQQSDVRTIEHLS